MLAESSLRKIVRYGSLTVIDVKGGKHVFSGEGGGSVTIRLKDPRLHYRLFHNAQIALGEAYTDGTIVLEKGSISEFLDICLANQRTLDNTFLQKALGVFRKMHSVFRTYNPVNAAQRKVAHHYDLRDELFDLFLDSDRQYSCGYFKNVSDDLEMAQHSKKLHLAAKLLLKKGQRVLDIGSGWGGLGLFLAGLEEISVDGVTLSKEQHKYSCERASKSRFSNNVRFHLKDYRELVEKYDRIVSVGMLEHVGPRHYGEFYNKVNDLLSDDGVALIHCIGKFNDPSPQNSWMEKYIFPGAYTPTLSEQFPWIERSNLFVTDVEILRIHYAETLRLWRDAFDKNRKKIANMYDEKFCRMWEFYLAGCEAAFRHGVLMVFQIQLGKALDTVPLTRDYIYDFEKEYLKVE